MLRIESSCERFHERGGISIEGFLVRISVTGNYLPFPSGAMNRVHPATCQRRSREGARSEVIAIRVNARESRRRSERGDDASNNYPILRYRIDGVEKCFSLPRPFKGSRQGFLRTKFRRNSVSA